MNPLYRLWLRFGRLEPLLAPPPTIDESTQLEIDRVAAEQ